MVEVLDLLKTHTELGAFAVINKDGVPLEVVMAVPPVKDNLNSQELTASQNAVSVPVDIPHCSGLSSEKNSCGSTEYVFCMSD